MEGGLRLFGDRTDHLQVNNQQDYWVTDASFGRVNNQQEQTSRMSKAPAAIYIKIGCPNKNNSGGLKVRQFPKRYWT